MTYQSILSSLWVWGAFAFCGALLAVLVFGVFRAASVQSREEERLERERYVAWLAKKQEREAEWRRLHGRERHR